MVKHLVWYLWVNYAFQCAFFLKKFSHGFFSSMFFPEKVFYSALFISAPGRSSTYELQSASQCHSRFFQCHLRRTPSALSPPPCTPCHLKRERVVRDHEHSSRIWYGGLGHFKRKQCYRVMSGICCVLFSSNVLGVTVWTRGRCNQTGKGKKRGTIK